MAARKRPAAAHATTTQGCKRSRASVVESTEDYEKVDRLGKGSFGRVHLARHRVTGKIVAIKLLNRADGSDELLREALFLDACDGNPYVVGFEGLVRNPATGALGLVMEYVAAPSLQSFVRDTRHGPPLPEPTLRAIVWKLLAGAKMMHAAHVVHRDIKPANILFSSQEDGELVKICDLGLALSMSELPPYAKAGTPFYKAPELLLGKPDYDGLVDTWSIGCVMAELVISKPLFLGGDDEDDDDDDDDDPIFDSDDIHQLWSIFRLLGTPDERTWPGFSSLPLTAWALQLLPPGHKRNMLRKLFPQEWLSEQGFELLQGLLTCNPDKRLTAAAALKHPWFSAPRANDADADAATMVHALAGLPTKKEPRNLLKIPLAMWNAGQRV